MAPQEIAALAAQVEELDSETARRVARLVVECNASLRLALSAVNEANRNTRIQNAPRAAARRTLAQRWFHFLTY